MSVLKGNGKRTFYSTFDSRPVPSLPVPSRPARKIQITSTALQIIAGPPSTYQTIYFVKADDTGHHLTQKYKDKDTDKDKYKDKDKDKVQIGPNMCYIFEKPRAQGCQI